MNAYTELKNSFDHLQKRAMQLFDYGYKREAKLRTAVANAWKHFGDIEAMDDADEMRAHAALLKNHMGKVLEEIVPDNPTAPPCVKKTGE